MAGTLEVLTGAEAVARTERVLCADAVTSDASAAEGLSATGCRAASIATGPVPAGGGVRRLPASCVHHLVGRAGPASGAASSAAFVLAATNAQQGVDQSLLAHMLSARLGRSGLCTVPSSDRLQPVDLPVTPDAATGPGFGPGEPEPGVTAERLIELAHKAALQVAKHTGREQLLFERSGSDAPFFVIAASGDGARSATEVAGWMQAAGLETAALSVALLHPFPAEHIRPLLESARVVIAVEEKGAPGLVSALAGTLGSDTKLVAVDLPEDGSSAGLAAAIRAVRPDLEFESVPEVEESSRLLVLPGGTWAEEAARAFLGAMTRAVEMRSAHRTEDPAGVMVTWSCVEGHATAIAISANPDAITPSVVAALPPDATIVIPTELTTQQQLVRAIGEEVSSLLLDQEIRLALLPRGPGSMDEVCGAALAALDTNAAFTAAEALRADGAEERAESLIEGARSLVFVDPDVLGRSLLPEEVDFRAGPALPELPEVPGDQPGFSSDEVRRFYRHGRARLHAPGSGLEPAALDALATSRGGRLPHPSLLVTGGEAGPVQGRLLYDVLTESAESTGADRTLSDNVSRFVSVASDVLRARPLGTQLSELDAEIAAGVARSLDLSEEEAATVAAELARITASLPGRVEPFDLRVESPVWLLLRVLDSVRGPKRDDFSSRAASVREAIGDLLTLDKLRAGEGRTPAALDSALGAASALFDPSRLAGAAARVKAAPGLDAERKVRLVQARDGLDDWLTGRLGLPPVLAVVPPGLKVQVPLPPEQVLVHPDPMAAAVGVFDGLSRRILPVLRAARIARLESEDAYRPEVHDESIANLDWEGLTEDEVALLPTVVVVATGTWLRSMGQTGFAQLLRSARPVLVLVLDEEGAVDPAGLTGFHGGIGWLAVGHREALVVQAPLSRPCKVVDGLVAMAGATRPAVGVVSVPPPGPFMWQVMRAEAALHGRSTPCLVYDPDGGEDWADRLDVSANPQPERDWCSHAFTRLAGGEEGEQQLRVTHAHALALDPAWRDHFRIIERDQWAQDQMSLPDYLDRLVLGQAQAWIPYILVLGADGLLRRAIITRELAVACRDRRRAWRVIQELAGYHNAHAERAAAEATAEAELRLQEQIAELERAQEQKLEETRASEARSAFERLAALLVDFDPVLSTLGVRSGGGAQTTPASLVPTAPTPEPTNGGGGPKMLAPMVEEEPIGFDDPYIDTVLCTSCNECTNINGQLFQYDGNKQAFIADANSGTYAELVRAAEQCPAKCIHPGKPRSGDDTATPDLVERAAALA
jgi:ferredoxin